MPEINYFWDEIEDNVVREYDENNNTIAQYTTEPTLYGSVLSQDRSGETRYFHFDGLGNTTELTDTSGPVTDAKRYSAFGEVTAHTGTTKAAYSWHGSAGYYCDNRDTTRTLARRRAYSSALGRWVSIDPLGLPETLALFCYVANHPSMLTDPSGLAPPSGTFAAIPKCSCTLAQLLVMKGVVLKVDEKWVIHIYHPGADRCFRVWVAGATAGNQCCFDKTGSLITWGAAAGTPDIHNPSDLLEHYFADVLPFNRFEKQCGKGLGWSLYHQVGWEPVYTTGCPDNPPRPRTAGPGDTAQVLAAIKATAERTCRDRCFQEMLETFSGPSSAADGFYRTCFENCYADEVERLNSIAGSFPVEIIPR